MKNLFQKFLRDDEGAAAVETVVIAAAAVGLMTLVAGQFDLGTVGTALGSSLGDGTSATGVVGNALAGTF